MATSPASTTTRRAQFGDGAAPDLVSGRAFGECSFHVVLQNPAAEAVSANMESGVGINEHFVVSTRNLDTYYGKHTSTNVGTLPGYPVTTSSGDSIFAELNDFTLTGNGLTGTADYTGGAPGQAPGEALLGTAYPDGSQSFVAYDPCGACSFDGQTGMVTLRAYGSTGRSGFTHGTFLITGSGTTVPTSTSPVPGLATFVEDTARLGLRHHRARRGAPRVRLIPRVSELAVAGRLRWAGIHQRPSAALPPCSAVWSTR